jgi:hypothetical protein
MSWDVENTDEFGEWFGDLSRADQDAIDFTVDLLIAQGPKLRFPHSSGINNSRHSHMRELRVQSEGRPLRILRLRSAPVGDFVDRRRQDRDDRFYERMIPIADDLYDVYLQELKEEGLIK